MLSLQSKYIDKKILKSCKNKNETNFKQIACIL